MRLVRLAQAGHPELEKLDIVLLCSSQNAQQFLGILLGSAVHFSEFKEDFHFTAGTRDSCHYQMDSQMHQTGNKEELELLLAPTATKC